MCESILKKTKDSLRRFILARNMAIIALVGIFLLFFVTIHPVFAEVSAGSAISGTVGAAVAIVVGFIAMLLTNVLGLILSLLIQILVNVAQFSKIIHVEAVTQGWTIVRDLCNMFFILILLVIAFATILRQENYSVKRLLPKLLIMAVLINFSKTIFGLIIDFAQVIMLTFVNGFAQYGAAKFIEMFNTKAIMEIKVNLNKEEVSNFSVAGAIIAGLIAIIITIIVVAVMLAVLVVRIVMLWVYTILSPLVFLGFAFPPIQKYTGKIWEDFSKQVIVGPVLAFFIWLALLTAQTSSGQLGDMSKDVSKGGGNIGVQKTDEVCAGLNKIFCEKQFQAYIISIALLIGGLMVTQQMGGAAASIAGKGMQWARSVGSYAGKGALLPVKGVKSLASFGIDKLQQKGIVDLNLKRVWEGIKAKKADNRAKRYEAGQQKAREVMEETGGTVRGLLAMTGTPGDAWEQITDWKGLKPGKGIRQRLLGGKRTSEKREGLQPNLDYLTFQKDYLAYNNDQKIDKTSKLSAQKEELKNKINKPEIKDEERNKLQKEIELVDKKLEFADRANSNKVTQEEKKEIIKGHTKVQDEYNKYVPMYAFEARAAEEKAVNEELGKIKNIDDAQELVRILKDAIKEKDKTRVKAVMKKLTQDYNDNEALEALVPEAGSGYEGLQKLMDELHTKDSRNYAGFNQQEAYTLGAQIAEMNKKTNHWEATAAYIMDNGRWRNANHDEHVAIASTEFGKKGPRANARDSNRLAMGKHIVDPETGEKTYALTDIGLVMMQSWDNETIIDRLNEDMTESAAKYLVPFLDKLEAQGFFKGESKKTKVIGKDGKERYANLADMIRTKAGEATNQIEQANYVKKVLEEIKKPSSPTGGGPYRKETGKE